jgi:hypothetical protein
MEPVAVSELIESARYLHEIKERNCPSIFHEISEYHPKQQPRPTNEIMSAREMRRNKRMKDEDYVKFWSQTENLIWLDCKGYPKAAECGCKYHVEQHNKECLTRIKEIERECIDKDMMNELTAVKAKREQFEKAIRGYSDKPLAIFN